MSLKFKHLIVLPGLVVALALSISACGKKGPLTLPDNKQAFSNQQILEDLQHCTNRLSA